MTDARALERRRWLALVSAQAAAARVR